MQIHHRNDARDIVSRPNDANAEARTPAHEAQASVLRADPGRVAAAACSVQPPPAQGMQGKRLRIRNEHRTVQVPGAGNAPSADVELQVVGHHMSDVGPQDKLPVPDVAHPVLREKIDGYRAMR